MQQEKLLYAYTRKQALKDGMQHLLNGELTKEAGYKYPVIITNTILNLIELSIKNTICDFEGIVWDILHMSKLGKKLSEDTVKFQVYISMSNTKKPKLFTFFAQCGALDIDDPSPCITIMTSEDL